MSFIRIPDGFQTGSRCLPYGLQVVPGGFLQVGSRWVPRRLQVSSTWVPHRLQVGLGGFHTDSR